jgi:hypothetical protein
MKFKIFTLAIISFIFSSTYAQDDLEMLLLGEMGEQTDYTISTFLSTHLLNSHSTELVEKNGLGFRIAHKFGRINTDAGHFFGFDDANSMIEANYAIADWWNIGLGRATLSDQFCAYTKFRLLRQSQGAKNMPVSVTLIGHTEFNTTKYANPERDKNLADRFNYVTQLLIARKINSLVSAQLLPTFIHRNIVDTKDDKNSIAALGLGASFRINHNFRANAEYYIVEQHNTPKAKYYNPLSVGISYQTSRHAFELFATNAQGVAESHYIAATTNDFFKGQIRVGFNVSTVFTLMKK